MEPIPSVEESPDFVVSAAPSGGGDVAVIGRPLVVESGAAVRLRNRATGEATDFAAAMNGSFAVRVGAGAGDAIEVVVDGEESSPRATLVVAAAGSDDALPQPCLEAGITVSPPLTSTTRIAGSQGAVEPGAWVLVGNLTRGLANAASADASGAFDLMLTAEVGDRVTVVARLDERTSPEREYEVPEASPGDASGPSDDVGSDVGPDAGAGDDIADSSGTDAPEPDTGADSDDDDSSDDDSDDDSSDDDVDDDDSGDDASGDGDSGDDDSDDDEGDDDL